MLLLRGLKGKDMEKQQNEQEIKTDKRSQIID